MAHPSPFPSDRTFIVAEVGNNHEGSPDVAQQLVREAAKAGVDAVKFQTFRTEEFVSPVQTERFARMKGFELSQDEFSELADLARSLGLKFMSTPLDHSSARFLGGIVDVMKIASGDITHIPLIREAAKHGLPMIISTGNSALDEIDRALDTARTTLQEKPRRDGSPGQIALLHCVSAYPTPPEQANLSAMDIMRQRYDCPIGYSDHTSGNTAAVLAVAAGARIIEKHFTLDNNYSDFRDHQLSADPAAMTGLVRDIRETENILGQGIKEPMPCEIPARIEIRRSIALGTSLSSGEKLEERHLVWLRPGNGMAPGTEDLILGRSAKRDLAAGTFITEADFD